MVIVCLSVFNKGVRAQSLLEQSETLTYSKESLAIVAATWISANYVLFTQEPSLEGEHGYHFDHHLNLGFGLHVLGYFLKNRHPDLYHNLPAGLRLIFAISPLITFDDAFQHFKQLSDGYTGPGDAKTNIYRSPLHQFYWNGVSLDERAGPWKLGAKMLDLSKRLNISSGYYQGIFTSLNYILYKKARFMSSLDLGIVFFNEVKRSIHFRKILGGCSFSLEVLPEFYLELGAGIRYGLSAESPYQGQLGFAYWIGTNFWGS